MASRGHFYRVIAFRRFLLGGVSLPRQGHGEIHREQVEVQQDAAEMYAAFEQRASFSTEREKRVQPDSAPPPPRAQKRKRYTDRTPSNHCHICSRSVGAVKMAVCANLESGLCRKVGRSLMPYPEAIYPPTPPSLATSTYDLHLEIDKR